VVKQDELIIAGFTIMLFERMRELGTVLGEQEVLRPDDKMLKQKFGNGDEEPTTNSGAEPEGAALPRAPGSPTVSERAADR
jgi:hypothetical protein